MANKKVLKSVRQAAKREIRNRRVVSRLRTQFKKIKVLINQRGEGLSEAVREYISSMDKAVKVGIIHRNRASRQKSMMSEFAF
ncbi:MAG: 30S ribosomal protein S20 [Puniceicoccales bacterium]|jgi:small subunit ribosomal protein S20|nr:30S ribosomal protein S20 [Puniceicoccales bacterium]